MTSSLNDFLKTMFGTYWTEAWLEHGTFQGKVFTRSGYGRVRDRMTIPDNEAVFTSAGLFKPGTGRADANVEKVMVLTIDDVGTKIDLGAMEMFAPMPTMKVETSAGNYQWQYAIDGGMDPDVYKLLRAHMKASPVYGHSEAIAPSNLIRVPYGVNGKPGKNSWKVLSELTGSSYTTSQLLLLFKGGSPQGSGAPASKGKADPVVTAGLLQGLVDIIPNDSPDRAYWVSVAHAVYGASDGQGYDGYDIFEDWASRWTAGVNDPAANTHLWDGLSNVAIGRAWLLREAEQADPVLAEAWLRAEARALFDDGAVHPAQIEHEDIEALQRDVANWIVKHYGDRIRYNVSTSLWHRFDGVWKESPHPLGYRLAKKWADRNAVALGKAARAAVSKSAFYEGVEKILRSDEHIAVVKTDFDRDDWLLGTPGGTVELRTGLLRASVASEMISLSCSTAPAEMEDCPLWLEFVKWVCTDPATKKMHLGMLKTLKQWAGYCLTGDVSEEMVMFFHGGGKNGKGTFIETMQWVLGDYFHMATKDLFMATKFSTHTEDIAALAGKRMVAADEVPTSARWNESLLKSVSGGGTISSRHLYGKVFTFPIRFKVTIIGNEKPMFQGAINEALKRRLHLAAFLNEANPVSKTLKTELRAEAAGILRWALNGLQDLLSGPGGKLFIADSIIAATEDYFAENDLFGEWLSERTEVIKGSDTPAGKMFEDWEMWRNQQGNHELYNSHKKFKSEMIKRGKTWKEERLGSFYKDLTIRVF